jgi:hypothetical protein
MCERRKEKEFGGNFHLVQTDKQNPYIGPV